jgi:hypothetical protein
VQARDPLHLPLALPELLIARGVDMHAVASLVLGDIAGAVGRAHDLRERVPARGDGDQPDASADGKTLVLPGEWELLDGVHQILRDPERVLLRAVLEQDAELIAAEARQGIALAQGPLEHGRELAQERIARHMAAGVVDELELVEVEIEQGVGVSCVGAREHPFQAALQLGPVDEAGERVMGGLIAQLLGLLATGDVLNGKQDQRWAVCAVQHAGVEDHGFLADLGEVMLNLEAFEGLLVG